MIRLTEESLFELGRLGETMSSVATKLKLTSHEFHQMLINSPDHLMAFRKGMQVHFDEYRCAVVPLIKEAFMERIQAKDTKAILWGMDNLVMVEADHPARSLDIPDHFLRHTVAETRLPQVNEVERRARIESLLSVMQLSERN